MYSIGGFTVAAAMLELASGRTFEQLMMEELFSPLGMEGCGFGPTTTNSSLPPTQPWGHMSDQVLLDTLDWITVQELRSTFSHIKSINIDFSLVWFVSM